MNTYQQTILAKLESKLGLQPQLAAVCVVGLGVTGWSVVEYLKSLGFNVSVLDTRDEPPFKTHCLKHYPEIELVNNIAELPIISHFVASPGIAMDSDLVQSLFALGAEHISDIDLFACSTDKPIVGITGSNGKSTVTTLLGEMALADNINVAVGGNLGTAVLDLLADDIELYIIEFSSFQLERSEHLSCMAATVLNISDDHLDRYENKAAYIAAKQIIYQGSGMMVVNADDKDVMAMQDAADDCISFGLNRSADYYLEHGYLTHQGRQLLATDELVIKGQHNQLNALAALALGKAIGLTEDTMCAVLKRYQGLAHRMQAFTTINGVQWINDSKATNVGACVAALAGFDNQQVILIAGGDAKGADMTSLISVADKLKLLLLIGKDAELIKQALQGQVEIYDAENLSNAVKLAKKAAVSGDVVLLSPACASLDQFKNYQQRGEVFMTEVYAIN